LRPIRSALSIICFVYPAFEAYPGIIRKHPCLDKFRAGASRFLVPHDKAKHLIAHAFLRSLIIGIDCEGTTSSASSQSIHAQEAARNECCANTKNHFSILRRRHGPRGIALFSTVTSVEPVSLIMISSAMSRQLSRQRPRSRASFLTIMQMESVCARWFAGG